MWYEVHWGKGNQFCMNEGDGTPGGIWENFKRLHLNNGPN